MRHRQIMKYEKKAGIYHLSLYKFTQRMCQRIARKYSVRGYRLRGQNLVAAFTVPLDVYTIPGVIEWDHIELI